MEQFQYRSIRELNDILHFSMAGSSPALQGERRRLVLGIGVFDGVHLGHRRIIEEVVKLAERDGAVPTALPVAPQPRAARRPEEPPALLVPLSERVRLLREAGAAQVWVIRFTPEFAALEPEDFLSRMLECPEFELCGICVGENWRFGRGGRGNRELLDEYARKRRIDFTACPELRLNGEVVSSSAIRRSIASGRLDAAEAMLGRPYRLVGKVEYGHGAATSRLDCPTANVSFSTGVLPPDGVYAAAAIRDGRAYPAAVNVGFAPTFGWKQAVRRLEVHLLDFSGNLYGSELGVEFLTHLREERSFNSPEELKHQIGRDIARIREYFSRRYHQPEE